MASHSHSNIHVIYSCLLVWVCFTMSACLKGLLPEGQPSLEEDFEAYQTVEELFSGPDAKWVFFQQSQANNQISLDTTQARSGRQCLKIYAEESIDGEASKSDLANNDMDFREGDIVYLSAWFFIEGTADLTDLFLIDIEEDIQIGAGPGMRLQLEAAEGYLKLERGKMLEQNISQVNGSEIPFPRNQWVQIEMETKLSRKKDGYIKVSQNQNLVLNAREVRTLPVDRLSLLQGTSGRYSSIQIGITANSPQNSATIYLDDMIIEKIN